MFLEIKNQINQYSRTSKSGKKHTYIRKKTLVVLRCDSCDSIFDRDLKHMDRKRTSNNYFHCCSLCDAKRFAQKKGVERKRIWDLPASLDWPVSKF
jgi:hypothetical protein